MITDLKINKEARKRYYEEGWWTGDTIADVWHASAEAAGDKVFVVDDQGGRFTYRQCDEMSDKVAAWLVSVGVEAGDVVTVQLPTWAEFVPVMIGIWKAGAVIHPVARNYSAGDLSFVMNKVGSRAFVCPVRHHTTDHEQLALDLLDAVPTLERARILLLRKHGPEKTGELACFEELLAAPAAPVKLPDAGSDDVACILSTSGTTGKPKQALLTHNNILFSERTFLSGLGRTDADVMFMPSPLNHATGLFHGIISPMLLRGMTVLQQDFQRDAAVDLINEYGITWSMGATPFIYDILHSLIERSLSVPTLKLFVCGGAPLPRDLVKCAHIHGISLCECYGSTESCPHAYVPPEHCLDWKGAWSGVALPGVEIRIVDDERRDVPCGTMGEEASRGPNVFVGYLNDPEQTEASLDDEGWFYSGDLAIADAEGRIHICGRKKEIIVRGGENISTREVDNAVMSWGDIVDSAVVGAPDERMGERICLFAVAAPGLDHAPRLDDLLEHLRAKGVSKRLWPERLELIDEIPRTPTGKVQRYLLTRELKARMGLPTDGD